MVIDDYLPTSNNSRILHVVDRSHPGYLLPALIEKGYLKVRGGYDFPGSNSGTDVHILTGWIPEQVFLHDEEVIPDELWDRVLDGFEKGNALLTIGTGRLPRREQQQLGIAAEHDYAILDMRTRGIVREMLIKNPWSDGDVWRGTTIDEYNGLSAAVDGLAMDSSAGQLAPGTFWMDFGNVFQHFENLYLNWNPSLFKHRIDHHLTWNLEKFPILPGLFDGNPQFLFYSEYGGEVWVLLNRHFRTGDYSLSSKGRNGYIALLVVDGLGHRALFPGRTIVRGPFVDSPNTMVKVDLPPKKALTAIVVAQDLRLEKYNFTVSVFSHTAISVSAATARYAQRSTLSAAWTRSTAGGNSDSPTFFKNPQFVFTLPQKCDVAVILTHRGAEEALEPVHMKAVIMYSNGTRVNAPRPHDIKASTGDYRTDAVGSEINLDAGAYTIICSTFEPKQYAKFLLSLHTSSTQPCPLRPLPVEGSGRLTVTSPLAVFSENVQRLLAPLMIRRITKSILIVSPGSSPSRTGMAPGMRSLLKISLEQGQGPYKKCLASSATVDDEYSNFISGVRIEDINLLPEMCLPTSGGLWLVLERFSNTSLGAQQVETYEVEVLTEERIEIGAWGLGDG